MSKGVIKWWNPDKGWGFIKTYDGHDVFIYYPYIESSLQEEMNMDRGLRAEGMNVVFDIIIGQKGLEARSVEKATDR